MATKVAIVTGASAGIGESVAIELSKHGYQLILTGRNADRLKKVANECKQQSSSGSVPLEIIADFTDPKQVDQVYHKTVEKFDRVDVLINNAGYIAERTPFTSDDWYQDYQNVMQVNLNSAARLSHLFRQKLIDSSGNIINISSIASRIPMPNCSYTVSKAALSMLTKCLANAFMGTGVRVNTVSPGPVVTNFAPNMDKMGPMTMVNRVGKPEEVASLILYLIDSEKSSFINASEFDIDGGALNKCPFTMSDLDSK